MLHVLAFWLGCRRAEFERLWRSRRRLANDLRVHVLSLDWCTPRFLVVYTFYGYASYVAYTLGYFIGKYARTPEMAPETWDGLVLAGLNTPRALRNYAWCTLWLSVGCMVISAHRILLVHLEAIGMPQSISPKLPRHYGRAAESTSRGSGNTLDVHLGSQAAPYSQASQHFTLLRRSTVLFVLAFAFIKKQHVGTTLIFHSVDSPALGTAAQLAGDTLAQDFRYRFLKESAKLSRLAYRVERHERAVVPRIVHFVFGMSPDFGGKPFSFAHYLAIQSGESAIINRRPKSNGWTVV